MTQSEYSFTQDLKFKHDLLYFSVVMFQSQLTTASTFTQLPTLASSVHIAIVQVRTLREQSDL